MINSRYIISVDSIAVTFFVVGMYCVYFVSLSIIIRIELRVLPKLRSLVGGKSVIKLRVII